MNCCKKIGLLTQSLAYSAGIRKSQFSFAVLFSLPQTVIFFIFLVRYSRNIPVWDDYISVLPCLGEWLSTHDLAEQMYQLNSQYFSHRIAATRMAAIIDFQLFGKIDFQHLQWCGWVAWLVLFFMIIGADVTARRSPVVWGTVAWLLMHPSGHSNFLIGMQAVQNNGILVCAMLVCYSATCHSRFMGIVGLALAAAAPWVSVNGLILGWVASIVCFSRGSRWLAMSFLMAGIVSSLVYFSGFNREHQSFSFSILVGNVAALIGSPFAVFKLGVEFAIPVGALLLFALISLLASRRNWIRSPALCGFGVFLIGTTGMLAYGRMDWGMEYVVNQDRYKPYGLLVVVTVLLLALPSFEQRVRFRLEMVALFLAMCFGCLSYVENYPICSNNARTADASALNRQFGTWFLCINKEEWPRVIMELERAEQLGYYRLPKLLSSRESSQLKDAFDEGERAASGKLRALSIQDLPSQGQNLSYDLYDEQKAKKFALIRGDNGIIFLPAQVNRLPAKRMVTEISIIDWQKVSYFFRLD